MTSGEKEIMHRVCLSTETVSGGENLFFHLPSHLCTECKHDIATTYNL
jgi:ribosomal protein L32